MTEQRSSTEAFIDAAQRAVRAGIDAGTRVAREVVDAGTDAARTVRRSFKDAADLSRSEGWKPKAADSAPSERLSRR